MLSQSWAPSLVKIALFLRTVKYINYSMYYSFSVINLIMAGNHLLQGKVCHHTRPIYIYIWQTKHLSCAISSIGHPK